MLACSGSHSCMIYMHSHVEMNDDPLLAVLVGQLQDKHSTHRPADTYHSLQYSIHVHA